MLNHGRNYSLQYGARNLKAWIGVDLDQKWLKLAVDHKIHAINLKIMVFPLRVEI